jgi:DNA-binding NtrC family response regulator
VLTDLRLPDGDGLEVLRAARQRDPELPVVVLTAHGSVTTAVEAMKLGASDFLEKPVDLDDLVALVASLLGAPQRDGLPGAPVVPDAPWSTPAGTEISGRHPKLRAALRLLRKVAVTDSTVLLLGESGTGKELFARALHELSPRAAGTFVTLNCAAIPAGLMENELFGHERGAFTGASSRQLGRFEQAQGGTLLLDEIGELDLSVQAKVLRVLEDRTFQRVGGALTLRADVRLVAATNRDLEAMVGDGTFRSDLFYRLDVFPITLPPLRERADDLPELCRHLLARLARRHGVEAPTLDDAAIARLAREPWPGNVRQLQNVLERAVILYPGQEIDAGELEELLHPLRERGTNAEDALRRALEDAQGDKGRAAEILGVSARTLQRRVRELGLEGFPKYRE